MLEIRKIVEKADWAIRDNEETRPSGILYPVHSHSLLALPLHLSCGGSGLRPCILESPVCFYPVSAVPRGEESTEPRACVHIYSSSKPHLSCVCIFTLKKYTIYTHMCLKQKVFKRLHVFFLF